MDILYTVLLGLFKVFIGVLAVYISMLFAEYLKHLKDKIGKDKWEDLMEIARAVVKAMEQVYGAGQGKKKKEQAMKFLTEHLHLTPEEADKLIEAAVFELNHLWETLPK